jgi:hypothetical protein
MREWAQGLQASVQKVLSELEPWALVFLGARSWTDEEIEDVTVYEASLCALKLDLCERLIALGMRPTKARNGCVDAMREWRKCVLRPEERPQAARVPGEKKRGKHGAPTSAAKSGS